LWQEGEGKSRARHVHLVRAGEGCQELGFKIGFNKRPSGRIYQRKRAGAERGFNSIGPDVEIRNQQVTKLKELIEKRNAVNARIKREQNKLNASERRSDKRRKILAGAAILEWAKRDGEFSSRLMTELKAFLVRDDDRALFGLTAVGVREGDAPSKPH
jgi:hypothetical protein